MNEQETFWANEIGSDYRLENDNFSIITGVLAWEKMLSSIDRQNLGSFLECGSNIGRNLAFLHEIIPGASANVIEINPESLEICKSRWDLASFYLGSIASASFDEQFDLVFSCGVLIHVNPQELLPTMKTMFELSSRYMLIAEYFNRDSISINYRGSDQKLFKRDFGKLFMENFQVSLIDCGFLWSSLYESGGFDDVTYWLFEKSEIDSNLS